MTAWIETNEPLLAWITAISAATFLGSLIIVPWIIIHIPSRYFLHTKRSRPAWADNHPAARLALMVMKNLAGYAVIAAGVAMLLLPGQGLITIAVGIMLVDFPGKYRLERRVVSFPPVLKAINKIRKKAGRPPLEI